MDSAVTRLRQGRTTTRSADGDGGRFGGMATGKFTDGSSIGRVTARSERYNPQPTPLASASTASSAPRFTVAEGGRGQARTSATPPVWTPTQQDAGIGSNFGSNLRSRAAGMNRTLLTFGLIAAILGISIVSMYGPLRDYYVARRTHEYLTVQVEQLESANAEVEAKIRALQTREGIEDEARRRGYIEEGSNAVNVVGLPEGTDTTAADSAFTPVEEVETYWYTPMLDKLFQYTPPTAQFEDAEDEPEVVEPAAEGESSEGSEDSESSEGEGAE